MVAYQYCCTAATGVPLYLIVVTAAPKYRIYVAVVVGVYDFTSARQEYLVCPDAASSSWSATRPPAQYMLSYTLAFLTYCIVQLLHHIATHDK